MRLYKYCFAGKCAKKCSQKFMKMYNLTEKCSFDIIAQNLYAVIQVREV